MVNIDNYKSRIKFEKISYVSNDFGGYTTTWAEVFTTWAQISPLQGREAVEYRTIYPTAQYIIRIRYRHDIKFTMRIFYNNRYLNILGPPMDVNNLHEELVILAEDLKSGQ